MLRTLGSLLAALLAASLLVACDQVLTEEANARLEPLVLEAIEEAEGGDVDRASETLDGLRDEVDRLLEAGELDADRAERILLAADQTDALLALLEEDEEPREPDPADDEAEPGSGDDEPGRQDDDPPRDPDDDRGGDRSGNGPPDHANDGGNRGSGGGNAGGNGGGGGNAGGNGGGGGNAGRGP